MNVLWLSWKDTKHPLAGGAETISGQLRTQLVKDGHSVRLVTASYPGSAAEETVHGVNIYRTGGRLSVYYKAFRLYRKKLADWPDIIIDEMNTLPFGSAFYSRKRSVLLTYQLARRVWFYQMIFPLSAAGYLLEPVYLFLMSLRYKTVLTESESTKSDLARYGFPKARIKVFKVGIDLKNLDILEPKENTNRILALGAMRPMKRTLSAVKAFEFARDQKPELKLTIAGDSGGAYAKKVIKYVAKSRHRAAIKILGRVDNEARLKLMRAASLILVTSIKEGWGLIVTEANSQGTPAAAYDCDGLRDSIVDGETGQLVKSGDEPALGKAIVRLLNDPNQYERMRRAAWHSSRQYTFENSYRDFVSALGITSGRQSTG